MKTTKRIIVALLAVMALAMGMFAACGSSGGSSDASGVKDYLLEAKYNSDEINQWKHIYLVDDSNYIITVRALDSKDMETETVNFIMRGSYTLDGDTLTIEPGYGYCLAMNGNNPIEMPITPDNTAMYNAVMGNQGFAFTLDNKGMTFDVAE